MSRKGRINISVARILTMKHYGIIQDRQRRL